MGRGEQGVSFEVPANTTVALVGESGSGKSVTAMALVQLLPRNAECSGRVLWRGDDLLQAPRAHMQRLRGREIACVFQDPMSSLNPVLTVGDADRRAAAQAPVARAAPRRAGAPRSCWPRWASPSRGAGSTPIRTSSRAASSSA